MNGFLATYFSMKESAQSFKKFFWGFFMILANYSEKLSTQIVPILKIVHLFEWQRKLKISMVTAKSVLIFRNPNTVSDGNVAFQNLKRYLTQIHVSFISFLELECLMHIYFYNRISELPAVIISLYGT